MKKGEVLAIYSPNLPEYAVAFHGVSVAGGVSTTINPLYTPEELARQLNDSKARFLLTLPPFLDKAMARVIAKGDPVGERSIYQPHYGTKPSGAKRFALVSRAMPGSTAPPSVWS